MHSYGSARAERVRLGVLWDKLKYGCNNPSFLGPEYCEDVRGTVIVEPLVGTRVGADRSAPRAPMFAHWRKMLAPF